jgi:citrate synthase
MSKNAIIEIDGNKFDLPLMVGSENETAIDISKLRDLTGAITYDPGYKNSGVCKSDITFLDGEEGILRYRGYAIEDLADKADFLEVSYLVIFGELPTKTQLEDFENNIRKYTLVNEEMKNIIDGFPKTAHPMGVLSALTSALTAFNPKVLNVENDKEMYEGVCKTMGKFLVLATWTYRKSMGFPLNYYDNTIGYVENFMQLMFKLPTGPYATNPVVVAALDKLFILHADHEQNCSTSTVRMVGSSHAGLFASISAGVSALWGPLHGGANQAVLEMLEAIQKDGGDADKYLAKAKDKNDEFRLMGFGHRVYKNFDPRAKIIKKAADEVLAELGVNDPILAIAKRLE